MTFTNVVYAVKDHVASLTLASPKTGNAFSEEMNLEVLHALQRAEMDPDVRVVVLRGEGRMFSAGGDLTAMHALVESGRAKDIVSIVAGVSRISMCIKRMPKPVIVAAHGAVAGAACNIALAADFCIAASDTKFVQAFIKIGLVPDAGGLFLLERAVGLNKAIHLAMTGETVSAEEAMRLGFVYSVCEFERLEETVLEFAHQLVMGPREAFAAMKSLVWQSLQEDWERYADLELTTQARLVETDDFAEGVRAFLEKRKPVFL